MVDLDEIEARALHVGEHGFYPNSHWSAGKVLCDVTALIAELRRLNGVLAAFGDTIDGTSGWKWATPEFTAVLEEARRAQVTKGADHRYAAPREVK